jgi:hypothetical protein
LADAVATQDTVTQLVAAIRKVAREVPGVPGQIAAVCTGHDYSRPCKPVIDWDEKLTRAARTQNSDPTVAEEFLAAEAGSPGAPGPGGPGNGAAAGRGLSWYGDSAYGTGDLRGAICDAGRRAVITPKPPPQAPVQGGFT